MLSLSSAGASAEATPKHPGGPGLSSAKRTPHQRRREPAKLDERELRLVAAIQQHDDAASADLVPYLRPSIEAGLFRVLRHHPPEFEDLVQETFERIVRTILSRGFGGRCRLTTWAQALAANVAVDALRRRTVETRYAASLQRDLPAPSPAAERRLEARSSLRFVVDVLSRMNPIHAEVTVLRHALDCPVDGVARQVGMSSTAAASQIRRAHAELCRRVKLRAVEL
jgi:RNA polymerase sigma-70 factor (ECF subfamily)